MATKKQCVLVTGAGRGLGRAIANAFHDKGFDVVATDDDDGLLADFIDPPLDAVSLSLALD